MSENDRLRAFKKAFTRKEAMTYCTICGRRKQYTAIGIACVIPEHERKEYDGIKATRAKPETAISCLNCKGKNWSDAQYCVYCAFKLKSESA